MVRAGASHVIAAVWLMVACCAASAEHAQVSGDDMLLAQAENNGSSASRSQKQPSPEDKMQARFPQPALVSHLIGLPVLDADDSTLGYVQQVVRTPQGKIQLIVPFGERSGWARDGGWWAPSRRLVAVPIESVAILALQIDAIDMDRTAFVSAPTWAVGQAEALPGHETIKIALGRR